MDPDILKKYEQAGKIAAQALYFGADLIKPGAKVVDILDQVEKFIQEKGAKPAFPAQIAINHIAAHFCPSEDDETVITQTDVVKLDVGVHVNGYVGDNALTINLDKDNQQKQKLVEASKAARDAAISKIKAGITLHEIGMIIQEEITKRGFEPVRNLSGHGVDQYIIHTKPSIPNHANGDTFKLEEGMVIAIEPFATTGKGMIHNASDATLFAIQKIKSVRSPIAREALELIKEFNGLPFTTRWLSRKLGIGKARLAIKQLLIAGILHDYPPLPEVAKGLVSQSEHTILIEKNGCKILTLP